MLKKKFHSAAFTLIELLVVITIIGILAGIALPVFNSVQVRGSQTKALAQAKQIGLALKLFAGDNDGVYPTEGVPAEMTNPTYANDAFAPLFPTYTQSESIFGNKLSAYQKGGGPDNVIDQPFKTSRGANTLKAGENVYGFMQGLNDASNPACPLVFDGPNTATGNYSNKPGEKGAVWSGTKAIVIRLDNSGALETLDQSKSFSVQGYDPNGSGGSKINVLDPSSNTSLGKACKLLLPQ